MENVIITSEALEQAAKTLSASLTSKLAKQITDAILYTGSSSITGKTLAGIIHRYKTEKDRDELITFESFAIGVCIGLLLKKQFVVVDGNVRNRNDSN